MAFRKRPVIIMNKQKLKDCLNQCLEDYMSSAEAAIQEHRLARASLNISTLGEKGLVIEKCNQRINMIMAALEELT
jgi:hypothetical protein